MEAMPQLATDPSGVLSPRRQRMLSELFDCWATATQLRRDGWDFSLELASAQAMHISSSDLRWGIAMGYIEHRREKTVALSQARQFGPIGNPRFTKDSCFALTPAGVAFFQGLGEAPDAESPQERPPQAVKQPHLFIPAQLALVPSWDRENRILCVGEEIVKEFKTPADNQERILDAFEELHWPTHIDDPLPPVPDIPPKRRLHDAINRLNRHQRLKRIVFRGDGSGERIAWRLYSSVTTPPPA